MGKRFDKEVGFGTRRFVPFNVRTDLDFVLNIPKNKGCSLNSFKVLINKCTDDENGVILFFDVDGEVL